MHAARPLDLRVGLGLAGLAPLVAVAAGIFSVAGCDRSPAEVARAGTAGEVLARIDGQPITRGDLEGHLGRQTDHVRFRYASPDRRKELLQNLIRFEVLAQEAQKRGYDRDPDVVRFVKKRAIEEMMRKELDASLRPEDIPETELEPYYRAHIDQFTQKEAVRVSQILVKDRAAATRIAAEARSLGPKDEKGFRRLVELHSEDEDSKQRGGDLTFLERDGQGAAGELPASVIEAASALTHLGEVSSPVASEKGFHILRLTQRRAGFVRPFEEVKDRVRSLLHQERRAKKVEEWVREMRGRVKIEAFEDKLPVQPKETKSPP
jgi:peptidyl-prolyl cis-trans isomerase C